MADDPIITSQCMWTGALNQSHVAMHGVNFYGQKLKSTPETRHSIKMSSPNLWWMCKETRQVKSFLKQFSYFRRKLQSLNLLVNQITKQNIMLAAEQEHVFGSEQYISLFIWGVWLRGDVCWWWMIILFPVLWCTTLIECVFYPLLTAETCPIDQDLPFSLPVWTSLKLREHNFPCCHLSRKS